jgi:hypothetical protein
MPETKSPFQYLPLTIMSKVMTEFEAITISQMNAQGLFETPENVKIRAGALLKKIFGEDAQFAILITNNDDDDDLAPFFVIDSMGLKFMLGATPEDDCFHLSFLSAKPVRPIRSLAGMGMALMDAMDIIDEHFSLHEMGLAEE